jgi:hypothetical protein
MSIETHGPSWQGPHHRLAFGSAQQIGDGNGALASLAESHLSQGSQFKGTCTSGRRSVHNAIYPGAYKGSVSKTV